MSDNKNVSHPIDFSKLKPHSVTMIVRGNENIYFCDRCGKEVKEEQVVKTSSGRNRNYAYCEECAKEIYPNYVKLSNTQGLINPLVKEMMKEAVARKEYRR